MLHLRRCPGYINMLRHAAQDARQTQASRLVFTQRTCRIHGETSDGSAAWTSVNVGVGKTATETHVKQFIME